MSEHGFGGNRILRRKRVRFTLLVPALVAGFALAACSTDETTPVVVTATVEKQTFVLTEHGRTVTVSIPGVTATVTVGTGSK